MAKNTLDQLLKKLQEGKCTEAELEQLIGMAKELPASKAERLMQAVWSQSHRFPRLNAHISSRMRDTISSRIGQPMEQQPTVKKTSSLHVRTKRAPFSRIMKVAAVAALLIGLGIWAWVSVSQFDPMVIVTTEFAEQKEITLPDGSLVNLNANSELKYRKEWTEGEPRTVWLQGEAYFEVAGRYETGQKFHVVTSDLTVEVLGTVFNVNTRREKTNVFLQEGSVSLKLNEVEEETVMQPGESLTYSSREKQIISHQVEASREVYTSWKDHILTFENTSVRSVLEKIEEIYGVHFRIVRSDLEKRKITTALPMENMEVVLPILEELLQVEIRQENQEWTVY